MEILKDTPFELGLTTWSMRPPQDTLITVVKATFDIIPGNFCVIADEQAPCTGDTPWDDEDRDEPSLRFDSDLAVFKPVGECFLHGLCHPPGGRATTSAVAFRLGSVQKNLAVFGERLWTGSNVPAPVPFTTMPLRWERAYGGLGHPLNPVGTGMPTEPEVPRRAPNLEDPARLIRTADDTPIPWGCFPVPRTWPARTALAGTYDKRWQKTRFPWFPEDFDWRYFLTAPRDQRVSSYWQGDEFFTLTNLHPEHPLVPGQLPGVRPRLFTVVRARGGGEFREVLLSLDTITLDAEAMQVRCLWRGVLDVSSDRYPEIEAVFMAHEALDAPQEPAVYMARMEAVQAARREDEAPSPEAVPAVPPVAPAAVAGVMPRLAAAGLPVALAGSSSVVDTDLDGRPTLPFVPLPDARVDRREELLEKIATGQPLAGVDFSHADLTGIDLSLQDLAGIILAGAVLAGARLAGARLMDANLAGADLSHADLSQAFMVRADLTGTDLTGADLTGSNLTTVVALDARMAGAVLCRVSAREAELVGADLAGADLREGDFEKADFTRARLDNARCQKAVLRDAQCTEASALGAVFDDAVLDDLRASDGAVFTGATFRNAQAAGSRWHGAQLDDANFSFATLGRADFTGASLVRALFNGCPLRNARFAGCNMAGAVMVKCDLFEGSLEGADLSRVDLRGANLHGAELWRARTEGLRTDLAIVTRTRIEPTS